MCDICWRESRDGLVIAGLVFSILALIYAIAMIIWVYSVERKAQPPLKCEELSSCCLCSLAFVNQAMVSPIETSFD